MIKSFFNRVDAEREVLALVNIYSSGRYQLAGLSSSALEQWRGRIGLGLAAQEILLPVLRDLSDACQRLSDRSHETFAAVDLEVSGNIAARLDGLRFALVSAFGPIK